MPVFVIIIPLYILGCMLAAYLGRNTRIGYWGFFFISVMLTPISGFLIQYFAYPKKRKEYKTKIRFEEK